MIATPSLAASTVPHSDYRMFSNLRRGSGYVLTGEAGRERAGRERRVGPPPARAIALRVMGAILSGTAASIYEDRIRTVSMT